MLVEHPDLHYELDHVIDAVYGGGCRIMLIFRSTPATTARPRAAAADDSFLEIRLRDELEQDLSELAAAVRIASPDGAHSDLLPALTATRSQSAH
jgi:hypothetical protein